MKSVSRLTTGLSVCVAAAMTVGVLASAASPKFYDDDPVAVERNTQDASGVRPSEIDLQVDLAYNVFASPGDRDVNVRAKNINTIDQVPDSSWYSNRLGHVSLTADAVARGVDTTDGPVPGPWTLTASKSDGVTPGFTITDQSGQRWFLKFDPPGHRGMATGTEVVVTKLMWALGYNVAENHIAFMHREQIVVADNARFTPVIGNSRRMQLADVDALLKRAEPEPDGSYRVIASKALEGMPLGGFRFYDTRPDDPNDIVPHEHRRELRGYGVFAAWLNHVDAKAINSLDTLVSENGRSVVRHHLLDFGSALGSGGVAPSQYWEGREYLIETDQITRQILGLGFLFPSWHRIDFYEAPAIGRLPRDNTRFQPERWKPRIPNQAFLRARPDDQFWAAERLAMITDEILRAVVRTGRFNDPESESFLVSALGERRDAIVQAYLTNVNPVVTPAMDDSGTLTFHNAATDRGVAAAPGGYRARWLTFDNTTLETRLIAETAAAVSRMPAPAGIPTLSRSIMKIEVSATAAPYPSWDAPVDLYFRRFDREWRLIGLERMPDGREIQAERR